MPDEAMRDVALVGPDSGERLDIFGLGLVVKLDGSAGGLFVAEHFVPPGLGVPPHIHDLDDEVFVIRTGALTLLGAQGARSACPGTTVILPRGVPHGFRNDGAVPVTMDVIVAPGSTAAAMFRALDRLTREAGPGGPSPAAIGAICAAHGVRFA